MTTLEKIKNEIEQLETLITKFEVLDIIDKYAGQEPTSPCDLCIFDRMDGDNKYCGYCGECPATAKGGE